MSVLIREFVRRMFDLVIEMMVIGNDDGIKGFK